MRLIYFPVMLAATIGVGLAPAAASGASSPARVNGHHQQCVKVAATIPVGTDPIAIAASQKTNTIYVANFGDRTTNFQGSVSVISG